MSELLKHSDTRLQIGKKTARSLTNRVLPKGWTGRRLACKGSF